MSPNVNFFSAALKNYIALSSHSGSSACSHNSNLVLWQKLVPAVVNINWLTASMQHSKLHTMRGSKYDFTSHAPQLQIFTGLPYITIISQNKPKKHKIFHFQLELGGAPGILYHMKSQKHQLLLLPTIKIR